MIKTMNVTERCYSKDNKRNNTQLDAFIATLSIIQLAMLSVTFLFYFKVNCCSN
jgi:hypothetical protein